MIHNKSQYTFRQPTNIYKSTILISFHGTFAICHVHIDFTNANKISVMGHFEKKS